MNVGNKMAATTPNFNALRLTLAKLYSTMKL